MTSRRIAGTRWIDKLADRLYSSSPRFNGETHYTRHEPASRIRRLRPLFSKSCISIAKKGEPDVVGHDHKTGEYFFMIVQRKILKAAEVFVTTVKRWRQGKSRARRSVPYETPSRLVARGG